MATSFCFGASLICFLSVFVFKANGVQILSQNTSVLLENEKIYKSNETVELYCVGTFAVDWILPTLDEEKPRRKRVLTNVTIDNYEHAIKLEIENISNYDVGEYVCKDVSWKGGDTKSVYIWVDDKEILSVHENNYFLQLTAVLKDQGTAVTFPCRPSHPEVEVKLTNSYEEIPAEYDPKKGFTIMVYSIKEGGSYECTYNRPGSLQEYEETYSLVIQFSDLKPPIIKEENNHHNIIGDKLTLVCNYTSRSDVSLHWITPNKIFDETRMNNITYPIRSNGFITTVSKLEIFPTVKEDNGTYVCTVSTKLDSKNNTLDVKLKGKDEHYLRLVEERDSLIQNDNTKILQWKVKVEGHPHPTVSWYRENENLPSKYKTSFSDSSLYAYLDIKNLNYMDYGNVTIKASNPYETKTLKLFINVTDKPYVKMNLNPYYYVNSDCEVECVVTSNPPPLITWMVKRCETCGFKPVNGTVKKIGDIRYLSKVVIKSFQSGRVKCIASNSKGYMENEAPFLVTDIKDGFNIFDFDMGMNVFKSLIEIALGQTLTMTCGVDNASHNDVDWFYNGVIMENGQNILRNSTNFSNLAKLSVSNIDYKNSGNYSCKTRDNKHYRSYNVQVLKPSAPRFRKKTEETFQILIPQSVNVTCDVSGLPRPYIKWLKDSKPFEFKKNHVIQENEGLTLRLVNTDIYDEGIYTCVASNVVGEASHSTNIIITNKPGSPMYLYFIIAIILVAAVILAAFLLYHMRKEKKLQRELKAAGLANFEKGQTEQISSELGVDEQADLLPYDKKWEFPIENLTLGKQLGSGAFGVVLKAEAKNIMMYEDKTAVAVKMVKKNADNALIKALASELKIMVHLGQHLNVVNLLGAVTKNVAKRELMVIVEYCKFGNLQNYLLKHRNNFINQLDANGSIDYSLSKNRHSSVSNPRSSKNDYRGGSLNYEDCQTGATEMTNISNSEGYTAKNYSRANSMQPGWRSNYKSDYSEINAPLCTRDLVSYCYQITRGMGYLASRKVLHGDLAARNVLLAENNVVKICDFGLAKSMYNNENYKKKSDGPLPLKWMAIESIMDKIFSTQSDVWSFGVTAWEIFSLSRSPYPGMEADERLFYKLLNGYRMEKPQYASKEIYDIMMDCWMPRAIERPSFEQLEQRFGDILEETTKQQYLDLNDPYMQMNSKQFQEGSDYLAMMNSPTFQNLSSPNQGGDGYLTPNKIKDVMFDFNVGRQPTNEAVTLELQPMLHTADSDVETPSHSPQPCGITNVANPAYSNLPNNNQTKKEWVEKPYVNHGVIV